MVCVAGHDTAFIQGSKRTVVARAHQPASLVSLPTHKVAETQTRLSRLMSTPKPVPDHSAPLALPLRAGVALSSEHLARAAIGDAQFGWTALRADDITSALMHLPAHLTRIGDAYPIVVHDLIVGRAASEMAAQPIQPAPERLAQALWDARVTPAAVCVRLPNAECNGREAIACDIEQIARAFDAPVVIEWPPRPADDGRARGTITALEIGELPARIALDFCAFDTACRAANADPYAQIETIPHDRVAIACLPGHIGNSDDHGLSRQTTSRDRLVVDRIWDLYAHAIARFRAFPTLLRWSDERPDWQTVIREVSKADALLRTTGRISQFSNEPHAAA